MALTAPPPGYDTFAESVCKFDETERSYTRPLLLSRSKYSSLLNVLPVGLPI